MTEDKAKAKEIIVKVIERDAPITGMRLASNLSLIANILHNEELEHLWTEIPNLAEELVNEDKIVEIEYILPNTERIKSIYLPKGTKVKIGHMLVSEGQFEELEINKDF